VQKHDLSSKFFLLGYLIAESCDLDRIRSTRGRIGSRAGQVLFSSVWSRIEDTEVGTSGSLKVSPVGDGTSGGQFVPARKPICESFSNFDRSPAPFIRKQGPDCTAACHGK
jgi:hypothetical protein